MRRLLGFTVVGLLLVATTGCTSTGAVRPEALLKDLLGQINKLAASFEKKEPAENQKAIFAKLKPLIDQAKSLTITPEERAKLQRDHGAAGELAYRRLRSAMGNAGYPHDSQAMLNACTDALRHVLGDRHAKPAGP